MQKNIALKCNKGEIMKKMVSIIMVVGMVLSGLIAGQLFLSTPVEAPGSDLPDLTISQNNITVSSTTLFAGEPINLNATIWNIGNADATNITVNFYEEDTLIDSKSEDLLVNKTWSINTLDSTGSVGGSSSIAVDDEKGIHISYRDSTNEDLKYAYKPNGGSWNINSIDSIGDVGSYTSIGIDSVKGIHISYSDSTKHYLKYAYKSNEGSWNFQTIDSKDSGGFASSLVVDDSDGIHIGYGYYNGTDSDLKYAYKPIGGTWTNQTVDSFGNVGIRTSIAVDNAGGIHISYHNTTIQEETKLKYAYKPSGGGWSYYTIDNIGENANLATSIAIDDGNGVHISYYEETNGDLKYAYKPDGGSWTNYTIDSPHAVGRSNSMAIDNENGIHISYLISSGGGMKYAYKPDGGSWETYYIDFSPGGLGIVTPSVAIDHSNAVHISYHDRQVSDLKYAYQTIPSKNIQVSFSWIPSTDGLRNITVKIDENNEIEELDETNNEATISIQINDTDSDFDGLTNVKELSIGSSPHNNDTDGDNLGDGFEVIFSKTSPDLWDTNANGIGDGLEFIQSKGYLGWIESLPDDWIGMTITWDNYTILVKTNSSVLEGEFDKEEQELKIKVSGPEGTQGVTEIEVPKSLCEPEDIEIILDGELVNYTLTEDDTYYYIHIEYNHSIHELSASFGYTIDYSDHPKTKEEDSLANIYLTSLIIALIVILLQSMVIIRNKGKGEDIGVQELPPEKLSLLLDKQHDEGKISDEAYNDAKSLLEKYSGE
jgi:hypothetical protein